jgi:acetyltransferase
MTGNVALFSDWQGRLESAGGIAFYYNVDLGVRVLTAQRQYHDFCRRPVSAPEQLDSKASVAIRRQINASRKAGRTILSEWESKALLRAAGIELPAEELVATPAEAAVAAQRIGSPVVLKIVSPDIAHKSDIGAARVALDSPAAVEEAAAKMLASVRRLKPQARIDGLLVAEMVTGGLEVIAGISIGLRQRRYLCRGGA